ncbi:hypothetical protein [Deinococcus puniceus]|uniref:hypothetical protein n=1 Tax=Deinococcus puniceus TaxID=1182568 RepID=UPI0012FCA6DB|nr:hypothetical protein [Deinococcus puniceus]
MLNKISREDQLIICGGATKDCFDMVGNFLTMIGTAGGAFVAGAIAVVDPEPLTKTMAGFGSVAAAGGTINSAVALGENLQECRSGNPPKQVVYSNSTTTNTYGGGRISSQASATYNY